MIKAMLQLDTIFYVEYFYPCEFELFKKTKSSHIRIRKVFN